MKIIPVEEIPKRQRVSSKPSVEFKPTRYYLREFMKMGVKCAKVDLQEGDYVSVQSAYHTLWGCATEHAFPIDVIRRGDDIYLSRRDI